MQKAMNQTWNRLEETLPLELISRSIAYSVLTRNYTCKGFVLGVYDGDEVLQKALCNNHSMTDPDEIKFYINATWYGEEYVEYFKNETGFTDAQVDQFFDLNNPASFGSAIVDTNGLNAVQFECGNLVNCTSNELADMQWGASKITMNPRFAGPIASKYLGETYTISDWGKFKTYSAPVPLEFKYYQQTYDQNKNFNLDESQVRHLLSESFALRGMNNVYNSVTFANAVQCNRRSDLGRWEDEYEIVDYYYFSTPMQYMVEYYIMGGYLMNKTAHEMIFGFNSTIAPLVNGGDFLQGNDFALTEAVTPVFNDQIGAVSKQQISMKPGSSTPKKVGMVKWQNGQEQLNRPIQLFNGVTNTTIYKGMEDELDQRQKEYFFNETSTNGMQFRPTIDNGNEQLDELKVFDAGNLLFTTFKDPKMVDSESHGINIWRYNAETSFNGNQNVSMAYE